MKIAIVGYGNLGKACEKIACDSDEFELVGIFSRRNPDLLSSSFGTKFYRQEEIFDFEGKIDVVALCLGSANDLTDTALKIAGRFNTVDSFDTHAKMAEYSNQLDEVAKANSRLCFYGIGWDPGLFSMMRAMISAVIPKGITQTFWGRGVSQGHSEAIRRIDGVKDAKQYTIPKDEALEIARSGGGENLSVRDKHLRECYVVAEENTDKARIENEIKSMPNYFADYDTIVHFIDEDTFAREHQGMEHGGFVMRHGYCNDKATFAEFSLKLDSNPDFTASVLMRYAIANAKLHNERWRGAKNILDIPISAILSCDRQKTIKDFV